MNHIPVFPKESLQYLLTGKPQQNYLDATFGRGGHSQLILNQIDSDSHLYVCDRDTHAIELAQSWSKQNLTALHCNYSEVFTKLKPNLDGILADLGLCSFQLDDPERGFSFRQEGPLDMRMDPKQSTTALDVIKKNTPKTLADIIYNYGEERRSRPIAKEVYDKLQKNQLKTTKDLAQCAIKYYPKGSDKHPATRLFQALRIATNDEFYHIENFLKQAALSLNEEGKLVIITFHSLEYKIVKDAIAKMNYAFRHNIQSWSLKKVIHPLFPTEQEIKENPRSRSARLHIYEKVGSTTE